MSSRGPSHAALSKAINGPTDNSTTQIRSRPAREHRLTEKAQHISDERREREAQRRKPHGKKSMRPNQATQDVSRATISSRNVDVNTQKTTSLDLRPQSGRVPVLKQIPVTGRGICDDAIMTQASGFTNSPRGRDDAVIKQTPLTGRRICDDAIMTQASGFTNSPRGYSNSGVREKRQLTSARATELIQRRRSVAANLFPSDGHSTPDEDLGVEDDQHEEGFGTSSGYQRQATNGDMDDESDAGADSDNIDRSGPGKRYREVDGIASDHHHDSESDNIDRSGPGKRYREVNEARLGHHHDSEQDPKRARVSAGRGEDYEGSDAKWRNPQKIRASKGHVAAKDFEVAVQQILKIAIGLFRSHLTAENAYLDRITQVTWAKEAWMEACKECNAQINFDNETIQLITNRTWHLTGELKTKICPLVESIYGFESSTKAAVQALNRKLVIDLLEDFGFCYKSLGDPDHGITSKGLYENKITQKAINISFYRDKKDEGVVYPQYFQPFPMAGMALILTAIEASIDEWSSGERCDIPFSEPIYKPVYNLHLNQLRKFEEGTKAYGILPKMLKRFNVHGRRHAKVDTSANEPRMRGLPADAIAAAVREYEMRDGNLSEDDE